MPRRPVLGIELKQDASLPLYRQLHESLRAAILEGRLAAGERLPASRPLALELGISRTSVVNAYDQLAAEGFVESRVGSGITVRDVGGIAPLRAAKPPSKPPADPPRVSPPPLQPGRADPDLLPKRQWARTLSRLARRNPTALIQLDHPFGDSLLRRAIARHLAEWRGIDCQPEQILVTAGSGEALEIAIRLLSRQGDQIAVENPGYPPLRDFIRLADRRVEWLEIGPDGTELPAGADPCSRLAIVTPSHQFPLGGTLSPERRQALLDWAGASGSWIIEDDYDSEYRYAGRPIPALTAFDTEGLALYVGSFSKLFSADLRLGYLLIPTSLLDRFHAHLHQHGSRAGATGQRVLGHFMEDGDFHRHLRRSRRIYAERRNALTGELRRQMHDLLAFDDHHSGMQIATRLRVPLNDQWIVDAATHAGLAPQRLSAYYARDPAPQGLLLGFCATPTQIMTEAVTTLRKVIETGLEPKRHRHDRKQ